MNSQGTMKRIHYYDVLRAFAILCIVSCHVFAKYVTNQNIFGTTLWYYSLVFNSLRNIGVPLFIVLSGCLLLNKKENISSFLKKRVSRVIPPYIFWALILLIFTLILNFHYGTKIVPFSNLTELFFNIFSIKPKGDAVYLWFVPMIFTVYMIIFIINKLNERFKHILEVSLILSILITLAININLLTPTTNSRLIFYVIFAIIGYYIDNIDFSNKISPKYLYMIFALIFIITYSLEVYFNASTALSLNKYVSRSQFGLINIISVYSIFLFIKYFIKSYETNYDKSNISKIVRSISNYSYGIYLAHMIIRDILIMSLANIKNLVPGSILSTLTLIMTFAGSWLLIWILSKIPYIKKICGAS